MQRKSPSPLDRMPSPADIHNYMGRLHRELTLLRRLLRLAQSAQARQHAPGQTSQRREVSHAG